jgi:23S rRNA (guanosine2251-2'-O)-methyltransferase
LEADEYQKPPYLRPDFMTNHQKSIWLYGFNPVMEAIKAGRQIKTIYLYSGRHKKIEELKQEAETRNIPLKIVDRPFFDKRFPKGHQGIAAEVRGQRYVPLEELLSIPERKNETPFFVILDLIEDPRNLGAILRSAEAAGVHGVIIQKRRSAGVGPEAAKASAGASEHIPVCTVSNIKHAISRMKAMGIEVAGAEAEVGLPPWELDLSGPVALVIGSEGKGLRKTVRDRCDIMLSLPMLGRVNSLNTSVSAGILIYEILRQRLRNR